MRVVDEFRARTGSDPAVVASAPGRVNLIGEHLDYNGGRSLPIALPCRTYAAAGPRTDGRLVLESLQLEGRVELDVEAIETPDGRAEGWAAYVAGVVWALGLGGTGATMVIDGQVPTGSGLSSSAALECAVALAVIELAGASVATEQIVRACVRAENEYVGAKTGSMDQTVAMFAQPGHALLIDFTTGAHKAVPWHPDGDLLVIDTKASHALVGGEYAERRRRCEEAAAELGVEHLASADLGAVGTLTDMVTRSRARHVVTESARVRAAVDAMKARDWDSFGRLMNESHASLRDDYEVSCAELDVAVESSVAAGALGARMTGGGFGGSAIALVPKGRAEAVRDAVTSAFEAQGWTAPEFVDGTASGAAVVHTTVAGGGR